MATKIYDRRRYPTKPFVDIEKGEIFSLGSHFFIKIKENCLDDERDEFNAINLADGNTILFGAYDSVELCENVNISIE